MELGDTEYWRMEMIRSFYQKATWKKRFAWWPHCCMITSRRIWLEFAYRGTAMYTGPGDPVYEHQWHDAKEHLLWTLKGNN